MPGEKQICSSAHTGSCMDYGLWVCSPRRLYGCAAGQQFNTSSSRSAPGPQRENLHGARKQIDWSPWSNGDTSPPTMEKKINPLSLWAIRVTQHAGGHVSVPVASLASRAERRPSGLAGTGGQRPGHRWADKYLWICVFVSVIALADAWGGVISVCQFSSDRITLTACKCALLCSGASKHTRQLHTFIVHAHSLSPSSVSLSPSLCTSPISWPSCSASDKHTHIYIYI